jgi:hypothetical protein
VLAARVADDAPPAERAACHLVPGAGITAAGAGLAWTTEGSTST